MIKIIYVTDVHDSIDELHQLIQLTEADLYLISGDILYYAFYDIENVIRFTTLQEEFQFLLREQKRKIFPYDFASEILIQESHQKKQEDLVQKSIEYRELFHLATKTMKEKYRKIEETIQKHSNADCFVLPGNYDIDFKYTALASRNLHKKIMYFENITFGGYGGAPVPTSGIPEKLIVPYLEGGVGKSFYSEPQEFFEHHQPDVLVLHNPAFGYFDQIPSYGNVGSMGIRNYLDYHTPMMVLSGHIHEDYGIQVNKKGTLFLNPSNFGAVDSIYGPQEGGIFAEIYINKKRKKITKVRIKRLFQNTIYEYFDVFVEYEPYPKLEFQKLKDFDSFYLSFEKFFRNNQNPYSYY
ncbi:MAG: metallophosphoesterase [Leptospiraceae bacterium]|nr:metallophosphoesterase [Leptospiraceae bacterium]MDW7976154.1 metallophosphoesterase [Leptospiraceae bacterium]